LPAIADEFGASASAVTIWIVTGYLIVTIACQMPAGAVADRFGYVSTMNLGRGVFAAGTMLACVAPALGALIAGRLLMAAATSLMLPTAIARVRVSVPAAHHPRAFGAMGAVMTGASAIGPALGGLVMAHATWRVLFLINLPLVLISWLFEPSSAAEREPVGKAPGFDWLGSVLLGSALVLGVSATRMADSLAVAAGGAALLAALAFVAHARRAASPVIDLALFARRSFISGVGVIALQNLAAYALLVQVPFLFGAHGDLQHLGLSVMAMTATMALVSPVGGRLAERVGIRPVVCAGGLGGAAGIIWLSWLSPDATPLDVCLPLLVIGTGIGLSTAPCHAAALRGVDQNRTGTAWAALWTVRYIGGVVGTSILAGALGPGRDGRLAQQLALWVFAASFVASAWCARGLDEAITESVVALPAQIGVAREAASRAQLPKL
jgi:MFS family permease